MHSSPPLQADKPQRLSGSPRDLSQFYRIQRRPERWSRSGPETMQVQYSQGLWTAEIAPTRCWGRCGQRLFSPDGRSQPAAIYDAPFVSFIFGGCSLFPSRFKTDSGYWRTVPRIRAAANRKQGHHHDLCQQVHVLRTSSGDHYLVPAGIRKSWDIAAWRRAEW